MSDARLPDGVSMTALGVAWVRAAESERPGRLFDDPLAARFVAASGWDPPDLTAGRRDDTTGALLVLAHSVIVRTRFLDDLFADVWGEGCRQTVILGAGLDTRAFRLPWPPRSRCFELDTAPVLGFKERVLAETPAARPACDRIAVPCDLLRDWTTPLLAAGFQAADSTLWVAEGLLTYFTQAENDRLLSEIGTLSTPAARLAITSSRPGAATTGLSEAPTPAGHDLLEDPAAVMALWRWESPADLAPWLAGHGWAAEIFDREERAAAYGRPLRLAEGRSAATRTVLIDARRV